MGEGSEDGAARWMEKLARVMARVTLDAARSGVLEALAAGLTEEFDAALARIWLYDPADDALHAQITVGDVRDRSGSSETIPLAAAQWPVAKVMREGRVVVVEEIGPDSGMRDIDWARREGLRSFAGFPLLLGDRLVGAMVVYRRSPLPAPVRDALAVLARQAALALEHARVLEESHALQEVAAELAAGRDTDALAEAIVRRTAAVFGAAAGAIWLRGEDDRLRPRAVHGLSERFLRRVGPVADDRITAVAFDDLRRDRAPIYSADAPADLRLRDAELADVLVEEGVRSVLRLPLFAPGMEIVGMLVLYHRQERPYTASEARLAQTFADQAALALRNARLAEEEQRARETAQRQFDRLATLAGIAQRLLATTDLEEVLGVVAEAAAHLSGDVTGMVSLVEPDGRRLRLSAAHGPLADTLFATFSIQELDDQYLSTAAIGRALTTGRTVIVEDYAAWSGPAPVQARSLSAGIRAFIAAPLRAGPRTIGVLWIGDTVARSFSPDEIVLAEALADQAALAIEHGRLVTRGQEAAVLEERTRLARDLHDSVTQTLFSLSMLTSAARGQEARAAATLPATLARAERLAQEALTEMRALLYELRPEALAAEGLAGALAKLVDAFRVRTDVPVRYTAASSARLAPDVETAIFRMVQEALGNAAKHARATALAVSLAATDEELTIEVSDDGVGFDPTAEAGRADGRTGGMGLRSMRERATAAGLTLDIASVPGAGTTVRVTAPLRRATDDVPPSCISSG